VDEDEDEGLIWQRRKRDGRRRGTISFAAAASAGLIRVEFSMDGMDGQGVEPAPSGAAQGPEQKALEVRWVLALGWCRWKGPWLL